MNSQKYVPLDVVAAFPKMRSLTQDKELIRSVMRQCNNCVLDDEGQMVKPNLKTERTTLILRDISEDTTEEEIKAIFQNDPCGQPLSVRKDTEHMWYVQFDNEGECQKTAMALLGQTFKGKPIRARVKAENLLRGFYYGPSPDSSASGSSVLPPPPHDSSWQYNPISNSGVVQSWGYGNNNRFNNYGVWGGYPYPSGSGQQWPVGHPQGGNPYRSDYQSGEKRRTRKNNTTNPNGSSTPAAGGATAHGASASVSIVPVQSAPALSVPSPTSATAGASSVSPASQELSDANAALDSSGKLKRGACSAALDLIVLVAVGVGCGLLRN